MLLYCHQNLFKQSLKINFKIVFDLCKFYDYCHPMTIECSTCRQWFNIISTKAEVNRHNIKLQIQLMTDKYIYIYIYIYTFVNL